MMVVAVIALLAAICVPGFLRARKRSQATRVLEDLRLLDNAIDQYAIETSKTTGMNPAFSDLKIYVKWNTRLYNTGRDLFNHRYGPFTVDSYPRVPTRTFTALSDVADTDFWSPYNL
jgi:type II secretory pathway pseudopilin PulG